MVQSAKVSSRRRQPITVGLLDKLRVVWVGQPTSWEGHMLWAAASLCFFGFLRSGEITVPSASSFDISRHLTFGNVSVDKLHSPTTVRIRLKTSKTDPFREGVDVFVGKSGCPLCPVSALLEYLVVRGSGPGPLFMFQDGMPLTRPGFVAKVKGTLTRAGIDSSHFSGHSFRSGAATTAAERGIGDSTIKMLGRWKSSAYQLYVKTPRSNLAGFTSCLAKGR